MDVVLHADHIDQYDPSELESCGRLARGKAVAGTDDSRGSLDPRPKWGVGQSESCTVRPSPLGKCLIKKHGVNLASMRSFLLQVAAAATSRVRFNPCCRVEELR